MPINGLRVLRFDPSNNLPPELEGLACEIRCDFENASGTSIRLCLSEVNVGNNVLNLLFGEYFHCSDSGVFEPKSGTMCLLSYSLLGRDRTDTLPSRRGNNPVSNVV